MRTNKGIQTSIEIWRGVSLWLNKVVIDTMLVTIFLITTFGVKHSLKNRDVKIKGIWFWNRSLRYLLQSLFAFLFFKVSWESEKKIIAFKSSISCFDYKILSICLLTHQHCCWCTLEESLVIVLTAETNESPGGEVCLRRLETGGN